MTRGPLLESDAADAERDGREDEIQDTKAQDESGALSVRHGDAGTPVDPVRTGPGRSDGTRLVAGLALGEVPYRERARIGPDRRR